jgi:hypothetical protein
MPHPTGLAFNEILKDAGIILNKDGELYFIPRDKLEAFKMPPAFQAKAEALDETAFVKRIEPGQENAPFRKGAVYRAIQTLSGLDGLSMAIETSRFLNFGGEKMIRTTEWKSPVFKFEDNKIIADMSKGGKPLND